MAATLFTDLQAGGVRADPTCSSMSRCSLQTARGGRSRCEPYFKARTRRHRIHVATFGRAALYATICKAEADVHDTQQRAAVRRLAFRRWRQFDRLGSCTSSIVSEACSWIRAT